MCKDTATVITFYASNPHDRAVMIWPSTANDVNTEMGAVLSFQHSHTESTVHPFFLLWRFVDREISHQSISAGRQILAGFSDNKSSQWSRERSVYLRLWRSCESDWGKNLLRGKKTLKKRTCVFNCCSARTHENTQKCTDTRACIFMYSITWDV